MMDKTNRVYIVQDDKIEEFLELIKTPMITPEFYERCKKSNDKIKETKFKGRTKQWLK